MAGFTPVSAMQRLVLPDPVGIDQLKRRNALADMNAELAQRNALLDQQNAETYQRQVGLQADQRQADLTREQWAYVAQMGTALANAKSPQDFAILADRLAADPKYRALPGALSREQITPDMVRATLPEVYARAGMPMPQAPVPFEKSDEAAKIRMQADYAQALERTRAGHAASLERLRQQGAAQRAPGDAASAPKVTEGERTSANYLGRMEAAEQLLGDYAPTGKDYMAALNLMEGGAVRSLIANKALSEQGQKYYQAAADWVRAKLRKESGAVIAPSEMIQEIRTYFPMPGDSKAVIAQKASARLQAQAGMRGMSGNAVAPQSAPASSSGWTVERE